MTSEGANQQMTRLLIGNLGGLPQRNNVGVAFDESGRAIRYGLMNETKKQNEQWKSSDIIAPIPIVITPEMVGQTIAVYGAFEIKESGWHLTPGDLRGQAQLNYHNLIRDMGGFAGFVTNPAYDIARIIARVDL